MKKIITKIKNLFKKEKREIFSDAKLLKIVVNSSYKNKWNNLEFEATVFVMGLFHFDCRVTEEEIEKLNAYIPLYERNTKNVFLEKSLKINTNGKFPFSKIIYLLTSQNGTNLVKFYNNIYNELDKERLKIDMRGFPLY